MKNVILYSTEDCSLCDVFLDLLFSEPLLAGVQLKVVDIVEDDDLFKRFAEIIPVLEVDGMIYPGAAADANGLHTWLNGLNPAA